MNKLHIMFFCLTTFSCKVYQETDFRVNKKEKYQKECGFVFFCAFYEYENRIAVNFCTDETCDYYNTFHPLNCDENIELLSLKPRFTQTHRLLSLDKVQGTLHYFELPNLDKEIKLNQSMSLEIKFRNVETGDTVSTTYELIKNKYRYVVRKGQHG